MGSVVGVTIANNVNDKGSCVSRLLRGVRVPICGTSGRTGHLAISSTKVHKRLVTLLNRRICGSNLLGGPLLTSCLFSSPTRILRVGSVVRPQMQGSFAM